MTLLAIATALILTPPTAHAQQMICSSGQLDNAGPYDGNAQTDLEQTVCIGTNMSYAEIENDSYEAYQNYATLEVFGVAEEAIVSDPNGNVLYDSGLVPDLSDNTGGSSVEIDMQGYGPGDSLSTNYAECTNTPNYPGNYNGCSWDYVDETFGLTVQLPFPGPTLSVSTSGTPTNYGQPVTFTATIGVSYLDGEYVYFNDNGATIGQGTISGTTATFTTSALSAGTHTISASYAGDQFYSASTSVPITQVVQGVTTTTSVSLLPTSTYVGNPVTANISVSDTVGSYPDGTVNCNVSGTTQSSSSTLVNGGATWAIPGLPVGNYTVNCSYGGSAEFAGSAAPQAALPVAPVPQPVWNQNGSMTTPRANGMATLLPDGTVLLTGGAPSANESVTYGCCATGTILNTAETYDPVSGIFTQTANSMSSGRIDQTATLLNNGQVLVAGGGYNKYIGNSIQIWPTASVDLYNPSSRMFTPGPDMNTARIGHTATTLQDGTVLIVGGGGTAYTSDKTSEIFNPNTGALKLGATAVTSRSLHTATLLQNGMVLITGGYDQINGGITSSAELYNPQGNGTFTSIPSMNVPREKHTATLLSNGMVLIVGGTSDGINALDTAELYDPIQNTFTYTIGKLNTPRANHSANVLSNGLILIAGGSNPTSDSPSYVPTATAETYDVSTGLFTPTASMQIARSWAPTVVMNDGTILVAGGAGAPTPGADTNITPLASLETYAPPTIQGWVNPKYVVIGVAYAPPGSESSVSYENSITQGNTTTISDSFSGSNGVSVSIGGSFAVPGISFVNSRVQYTASSSSTYTQGSMSSNAVTLTKQASFKEYPKPVIYDFNPVDHRYDIIWLWLNPLLRFTVDPSVPDALVWNGYGFDPNDYPGQDLYPVIVGELTGNLPMDQSTATELSRLWAQGQIWPTGQGPGITTDEMRSIALADPFVSCYYDNTTLSYTSCYYPQYNTAGNNFGPPPPENSMDGRFTLVNLPPPPNVTPPPPPTALPPVPYGQGLPGTNYIASTTNTDVATQQSNHSFEQTFGIDINFTAKVNFLFFSTKLTIDTKYTQSLTWTHSFQEALTNTTENTSSFTIVPPPCGISSCNTYAGPGEFLVYQDNLYGTFMFYPHN